MSYEIPVNFINQFRSNLEIGLQQKGSKLEQCVRTEVQKAEFDFYDKIGATSARKVTERHGDTPLISTPHDRRRVGLVDYDWADLIDKKDKIRLLIDPTSSYSTNARYAMGRARDEEIINAFTGVAYTGKNGEVAVPFDTNNTIPAATSGLTISKLIDVKTALLGKNVDPEEEFYIGVTHKQLNDLLNDQKIQSADYNTVKALVAGAVDSFMGFKFIHTELFKTSSSNNRRIPAWVKSGMLLAVGEDTTVDIGIRNDKRNATQVYVSQSVGATRMDEDKVFIVECQEKA
jgi:hypothetical protein